MKTFNIEQIGNLAYQVRNCKVDGKNCGVVKVPYFVNFENLCEFVEKGIFTEAHACNLLIGALAIEAQANARRKKSGGKISLNDFDRISNIITADNPTKFVGNASGLRAEIQKMYILEQNISENVSENVSENEND